MISVEEGSSVTVLERFGERARRVAPEKIAMFATCAGGYAFCRPGYK